MLGDERLVYVTQVTLHGAMPAAARAATSHPAPAVVVTPDAKEALRTALHMRRIELELSIDELAQMTCIDAARLVAYERGTRLPKASEITVLQVHLQTQLGP